MGPQTWAGSRLHKAHRFFPIRMHAGGAEVYYPPPRMSPPVHPQQRGCGGPPTSDRKLARCHNNLHKETIGQNDAAGLPELPEGMVWWLPENSKGSWRFLWTPRHAEAFLLLPPPPWPGAEVYYPPPTIIRRSSLPLRIVADALIFYLAIL